MNFVSNSEIPSNNWFFFQTEESYMGVCIQRQGIMETRNHLLLWQGLWSTHSEFAYSLHIQSSLTVVFQILYSIFSVQGLMTFAHQITEKNNYFWLLYKTHGKWLKISPCWTPVATYAIFLRWIKCAKLLTDQKLTPVQSCSGFRAQCMIFLLAYNPYEH